MEFYFGPPTAVDFEKLVSLYPDDNFQKLTCSTVPLLAYWRDLDRRRRQLAASLKLPSIAEAKCHFEYAVPPPRGNGKASFTDLMLIGDDIVAIEAKHTETMYEPVAKWLKSVSPTNGPVVLEGWVETIARRTGVRPPSGAVGEIVYQAIHRLASACSINGRSWTVIYQVFAATDAHGYEAALRRLAAAFDASGTVSLWLQLVPTRLTADNEELTAKLETEEYHDPERTAQAVRNALLRGTLFEFGDAELRRIQP